ncbi:hypothetical protein HDU96_004348, partial [Phlyctochytrium bullatum]
PILTGIQGLTTAFTPGPTNIQPPPVITTTLRNAALEPAQAAGVPVTTAIAIASASSIASAVLFSVGIFVAWMASKSRVKKTASSEVSSPDVTAEVQDRTLENESEIPQGSTEIVSHDTLPLPEIMRAVRHIYVVGGIDEPLPDDDVWVPDSAVNTRILLGNIGLAEDPVPLEPAAVPEIIMARGAAADVGSQAVGSESREDVWMWSPVEVQRWMDSVGFRGDVVAKFKDHNIDGPRLLGLTDDILRTEIGIASSALRSMILSIRARFFFEPRTPADDNHDTSPSGASRRFAPGTSDPSAAVSSTAVMSEVMSAEVDEESGGSGSRAGSEAPPSYLPRTRNWNF